MKKSFGRNPISKFVGEAVGDILDNNGFYRFQNSWFKIINKEIIFMVGIEKKSRCLILHFGAQPLFVPLNIIPSSDCTRSSYLYIGPYANGLWVHLASSVYTGLTTMASPFPQLGTILMHEFKGKPNDETAKIIRFQLEDIVMPSFLHIKDIESCYDEALWISFCCGEYGRRSRLSNLNNCAVFEKDYKHGELIKAQDETRRIRFSGIHRQLDKHINSLNLLNESYIYPLCYYEMYDDCLLEIEKLFSYWENSGSDYMVMPYMQRLLPYREALLAKDYARIKELQNEQYQQSVEFIRNELGDLI
ncbi:MAG: hypothetical protein GX802_01445 [Clostridiales bacterium]|jgi:hypothetical protein|nr:hypothetical protein [Clostridiales bacterium]